MGTRVKTFDNTGIATGGRIYAGDLNLIQDQYADQANFSQTLDLGTLRVGETGLQLVRYGAGEARITGLLRTDGILRALGGLYAGGFTTSARNAIASGSRPYGLTILNTDNNQLEINLGSDATPDWRAVKEYFGTRVYNPATGTGLAFRSVIASEANDRFQIDYNGAHFWGPGGGATVETSFYRRATNRLRIASGSLEIDADANSRFIGVGNDGGAVSLTYNNGTSKGMLNFGSYSLTQDVNGSDVIIKSVNASLASPTMLIARNGTAGSQVSIGYNLNSSIEFDTTRDVRIQRNAQGTLEILNNYSGGYLVKFGFNTEIPSGATGIRSLRYHNGTAVTTGDVGVGAADSGGSGWRVLRVPN